MFSAEYREKTYQPIKFVTDDVDNSVGQIKISSKAVKKNVYQNIDTAIANTIDPTIINEEFKTLEDAKSPRALMTAKV